MAKFSAKMKGKEVGSAGVYAAPHTMSGDATNADSYNKYETGASVMNKMNPSAGGLSKGNYEPVNPYGVSKMRGGGAAIKGLKTSGKMG